MEPSWQPDPTGRHHYRWWDGKAWSDIVADDGEESHDPMPPASGPRRIVVSTTPEPGQWRTKDPTPWRGMKLPAEQRSANTPSQDATAGSPEDPETSGPDATEQMPVKPDESQPNRIFIDTTRSDIPRPGSSGTGPIYADSLEERSRPLGRWIAGIVIAIGLLGGAIYLLTSRDSGTKSQSENGVSTGTLKGPGSYYSTDIELALGETVRFRVEGPAARDLITYFLAPKDVADAYATQYVSDMGNTSDLTDPTQITETYTDARELFDSQDARDAMQGYVKLRTVDRCCKGVPDTWSFVASAPGVYRVVVVEADGKEADVRLVIESLGRVLITSTEISDAYLSESFFTDSGFFKSTDPYVPVA